LILIFRELGITEAEEAADMAEQVQGPESVLLPARDELLLYAEAVLNRMNRPPG
jgi:hypothetical protein